jgi:hypothetical protein
MADANDSIASSTNISFFYRIPAACDRPVNVALEISKVFQR